MQVRRNRPLFSEWLATGPHFISPLDARTRLRVGPAVHRLIDHLTDWTPRTEVTSRFSTSPAGATAIERALDTLIQHGIVQCCNGPSPVTDEDHPWNDWGTIAGLYHRHARDAPYITDRERKADYVDQLTERALPAMGKCYPDRPKLLLPRQPAALSAEFGSVLFGRRTHRHFTSQPVQLGELATLLQVSFGPQRFADGQEFGTVQLRTSPNAGARHEVEAYLIALDVNDLPAGIYHYDGMAHALEHLGPAPSRDRLAELLYEQPMTRTAPMLVITSAVTERITYKYRDGRAYRLWMYDVGHVGQTFALTATALGLGAFQTAAFQDSGIDQLLGLQPDAEFATYVLGCGNVLPADLPAGVWPARLI